MATIPFRHSLSVALAVKLAMDILIDEENVSRCSIEAYSNGREQGLHFVGPEGRASVAENRNSDHIVVYVARPAYGPGAIAFYMGGNIPVEDVYRNARYFNPGQVVAAAQFVLSMITDADHGYAQDREAYTLPTD